MTRTPLTLKIGAEERLALENLSKMESRPVSELFHEAIRQYLSQWEARGPERTISAVRTYRRKDPRFKKAIDEFVEAEAGFEDPLEGELMQEQLGPLQRKIRNILDS